MIDIIYGLTASNLVAIALLIYSRRQNAKMKTRPQSIELKEFLADLCSSGAILHIKAINPGDLILRSRRT